VDKDLKLMLVKQWMNPLLVKLNVLTLIGIRDRSVSIVTGHGLDGQGSIPGSAIFFSYPLCPDRLWGPPSLLFHGYRG
jgi:hypothetical protein